MGQKVHPIGFRVGRTSGHNVIRDFESHWYASKKQYGLNLLIDHRIRTVVKGRVGLGNISRVAIERAANRIKVTIFTARPGAIIGKGGKGIEDLTNVLNTLVKKLEKSETQDRGQTQVQVNVTEERSPETNAQLVAENICQQLERRISHRRAMRQAMTRAMRFNSKGIKVLVAGRLNGAEIARSEGDKVGKIPLHTIRADIDYGCATAKTIYGSVGCKVWIYNGEVLRDRRFTATEPEQPRRRNRREQSPQREAFGGHQAEEVKSETSTQEVSGAPEGEAN